MINFDFNDRNKGGNQLFLTQVVNTHTQKNSSQNQKTLSVFLKYDLEIRFHLYTYLYCFNVEFLWDFLIDIYGLQVVSLERVEGGRRYKIK